MSEFLDNFTVQRWDKEDITKIKDDRRWKDESWHTIAEMARYVERGYGAIPDDNREDEQTLFARHDTSHSLCTDMWERSEEEMKYLYSLNLVSKLTSTSPNLTSISLSRKLSMVRCMA